MQIQKLPESMSYLEVCYLEANEELDDSLDNTAADGVDNETL